MSHLPSSSHTIAPNTTTPIPNIIFDYWMERLTNGEFKVLCCICRKALGKENIPESLSLEQLKKMSGLSRSTIIQNIESLIHLGLITKMKMRNENEKDMTNQYLIHPQGRKK